MRAFRLTAAFVVLASLAGCLATVGGVKVTVNSLTIPTPFGILEINFSDEEREKKVATVDQLETPDTLKGALSFPSYDFITAPLPEGCKPFGDPAKYGNLNFLDDGKTFKKIEESVNGLITEYGSPPSDVAIAWSLYNAMAWQSWCGTSKIAKLEIGSKINGWVLNEAGLNQYKIMEQPEIDVTPKITIIAIDKKVFAGHLKPTSINLLLSKYRYEISPDAESIISDPKTGSIILTYRLNLENVKIGSMPRNILAGGVIRIFVGKNYIYVIDFYSNTDAINKDQWDEYKKYINSFKYVGD
jgi:hypothetical protein